MKRGVSMAFTPGQLLASSGRRGGGRKGSLKAPLKPKLPKNLWGNLESVRPHFPDPQLWKAQYSLFKEMNWDQVAGWGRGGRGSKHL